MELNHEGGHYLKIKYDWISVVPAEPKPEITFPVIDTGFLKDWNLVQIQGEEPVPEEVVDPKAKAPPKKPDPKKNAASRLEEITDNRARTVNYEHDFAEANNGVGLEVTEDVAVRFAEATFNLQVFDVDRETQEETLIESIQIDLSSLVFMNNGVDVSYSPFLFLI